MNQHLQNLSDFIEHDKNLSDEDKLMLSKYLKDANKEIEITAFKLDRTEKVKRTTAILLEETIEELEQKRKAVEATNRELEIESSLERVRTVAMSMNKADDMLLVCQMISEQLGLLKVKEIRNIQTAIFYEDKGNYMNYEYYFKHTKPIVTETSYTNHKMHREFAEQMLKGKGEFFSTLIGKSELPDWIAYQKTTNVFIDTYLEEASSLSYYWYSLGPVALGISTYFPLTEDDIHLFKRFRNVFELAYRRFLDIEKAIAQAREAQIEAALERVRSRSMGMQKSEELKEVIKIVYNQFAHLKINLDHAGFVVDYTLGGDWHFWIADEQDNPSKISHPYFESVWAIQFNEAKDKGNHFFATHLNFEEKNKFYTELLSYIPDIPEASKDFYLSCSGLAVSTVLFDNVSLYIENFSGNPYSNEENKILMRFAKVFEQTYIRFLDLQKAEAQAWRAEQDLLEIKKARRKAEQALKNLQEAQKQLIQSEKMASLGELTAGIAHEIQNPLNFVNNFSDVSIELLDEMKVELDSGNYEDVKEIANDVIQNLEKINHHGKRADAIVKGMLQHSRSSSGKKEPTNINALCDEYLRLSYHGLRAKDKTFNATLKSDFDESIGKIEIIPQDFGRVILNLLTNAFYAVNEKKQSNPDGYEPTVSISTKKIGNKIEIRVSDNGNGIPSTVADKIFQPFFTTKPTGQGTGLGLSLSYDIITKGHSGALIMETKTNIGTDFIIELPIVD